MYEKTKGQSNLIVTTSELALRESPYSLDAAAIEDFFNHHKTPLERELHVVGTLTRNEHRSGAMGEVDYIFLPVLPVADKGHTFSQTDPYESPELKSANEAAIGTLLEFIDVQTGQLHNQLAYNHRLERGFNHKKRFCSTLGLGAAALNGYLSFKGAEAIDPDIGMEPNTLPFLMGTAATYLNARLAWSWKNNAHTKLNSSLQNILGAQRERREYKIKSLAGFIHLVTLKD